MSTEDVSSYYVSNAKGTQVAYTQDQRSSPVTDEYGSLQKALASLDETVGRLRDRLDAIIAPSLPTDCAEKGADVQRSLSPFAERIRSDANRVRQIEGVLLDVIARLEI